MAFQPPSERDKLSCTSLVESNADSHEDVASIKSEPPDLAEVRYDLEGSNSCFGIPFTMDDTWTKTPLMEELDSLAATSASAASSLGEDDGDSRAPLAQATQWRMQGGKLLKVPTSFRATTPPGLSSLALRSPSKKCVLENRPSSPILSDSILGTVQEKKCYALADDDMVDMVTSEKEKVPWLTGYDSNSPHNSSDKFPMIHEEHASSASCEQLPLPTSPVPRDGSSSTSIPQAVINLVTEKSSIAKNGVLMPAVSGESASEEAGESADGKMFPCSICGMCFQSVTNLTCHVVNHALCRICGLVFRDSESLSLHEQTHHSGAEVKDSKVSSVANAEKTKAKVKAMAKKGSGGVSRPSKEGKASKKSLNQKMPCLALALSRDSYLLKGDQLVHCKKKASRVKNSMAKLHDPMLKSLKNHLANHRSKPTSPQTPKVRKKSEPRKEKEINASRPPPKARGQKCGLCGKKFANARQLQEHEGLTHARCSVCGTLWLDMEQLCAHQHAAHSCRCEVCGTTGTMVDELLGDPEQHVACDPVAEETEESDCRSYKALGGSQRNSDNDYVENDMSLDFCVGPPLVMVQETENEMDSAPSEEEINMNGTESEMQALDTNLGSIDQHRQQGEEEEDMITGFSVCEECGVKVPRHKAPSEHQCWVMRCPLCDKPFKSVEKLALHKITDHPGCSECDAVFKNFDSLTLHEELQHFRCAVCASKCSDHEGLMLHKRVEHSKCKWCKKWFPDRHSLLGHEDQGPYPCGECDAEFCSPSELVLHEKETHRMCSVCKVVCASRKELLLHTHHSCRLCCLEFLSTGALLDHQHRQHSKCPQCGLVFRDADTLARHTSLQHCDHIKCPVCAALFTGPSGLLQHLKTHVPCRTCATFFKDAKALAQHEKKDHGKGTSDNKRWVENQVQVKVEKEEDEEEEEEEAELVQCGLCKQGFTSRQKLAFHEKLDHETCRQCSMVFSSKTQLSLHRKTAHKTRKKRSQSKDSVGAESLDGELHSNDMMIDSYIKEEDWDEAEFREALECKAPGVLRSKPLQAQGSVQHAAPPSTTSEEDRDWACSMCPKAFPSKKNLNAHYRRVHMEKSLLSTTANTAPVLFKCSFCPQTFTCRNDFVEHNRDCSKGKRVPCNICGKTFSTSGNLAQHKRIHTSEKPYKCDTCGKAFAQNGTLYRHKTVHTKETPFACQACGKQFGLKGNLVMHLRNIHKIVYKDSS